MTGSGQPDELLAWLRKQREAAREQFDTDDLWDTDRELAVSLSERASAYAEVIRHIENRP